MQQKSSVKFSVAERLDALRLKTQATWAELAHSIGLSDGMVYQVKSGKKELSTKAIYRLEQAERAAGLAPPLKQQLVEAHAQGDETFKKIAASASLYEWFELLPPDERIEALLMIGKKMSGGMVEFFDNADRLILHAKEVLASPKDAEARANLEYFVLQVSKFLPYGRRFWQGWKTAMEELETHAKTHPGDLKSKT